MEDVHGLVHQGQDYVYRVTFERVRAEAHDACQQAVLLPGVNASGLTGHIKPPLGIGYSTVTHRPEILSLGQAQEKMRCPDGVS
ncbi:hypothetical protein D3C72_1501330 [compost metagenome]